MKSNKPENINFSFEDFEKGLMLAGLISPANITELEERQSLEAYEKEIKKEKSNLYFKRAVLAAEIASELNSEPTFGRIKFQKLVYLCEHVAKMGLQYRYSKQAAGPFDHKFMHSIEREFKKQNWFEVEKKKEGNFNRSKYIPLPGLDSYKKYYLAYFEGELEDISELINLFRKEKTDKAEIAATLFACYLELQHKKEAWTETQLLEIFYAWSPRKKQYSEMTVRATWVWMKEHNLIPSEVN